MHAGKRSIGVGTEWSGPARISMFPTEWVDLLKQAGSPWQVYPALAPVGNKLVLGHSIAGIF